jgi:hypothetical protein
LINVLVKSLMDVEVMDKRVTAERSRPGNVLRALDVSMIQMITVVELIVLGIANAMSPVLLWTVSGLSSVNGPAIQPGMRMAAKPAVEY